MTMYEFCDPRDADNFMIGMRVEYVMTPSGALRPATRRERWMRWLKAMAMRATRWWRPRTIVAHVDSPRGMVAFVTQRSSWRRWRWEP